MPGPNLQKLIDAHLVDASRLPNATDVAAIENLNSNDVDALIRIYHNVGVSFIATNCGVTAPGPGPARSIGIVF